MCDVEERKLRVYLCLFMCVITRALHLEIVKDLSTETFLLAFRRFAARRLLPTIMVSDNASTYLSATNELQFLMQLPEAKREVGKQGVTWKFTPREPHGGVVSENRWWDLPKQHWRRFLGDTDHFEDSHW